MNMNFLFNNLIFKELFFYYNKLSYRVIVLIVLNICVALLDGISLSLLFSYFSGEEIKDTLLIRFLPFIKDLTSTYSLETKKIFLIFVWFLNLI
jgi:hypothetical protein